MTRRSAFLRGGAAIAACAFRPALAGAQSRALAIGYVPSTLFAPLFVALARGYVTGAGFTPNAAPVVAGQDAIALLAQGQLDLVAAGLSAAFFNAVNRGLEVKFVASTGYQPRRGHPTALMAREDLLASGLRNAGGLRGRKIGWIGGAGATSAYYVARILRPYGLTLHDVEYVNIANPDQGVALERKAIDAVFTSSPFTEAFEERKLARTIATVQPGISATGIFFGPTLLRDPNAARAVMSTLRHGARDVTGEGYYRRENLDVYATYTKTPVDVLRRADRYDFKPDLAIDQATLEDMQREFVRQNILAYHDPLNEVRLVARF